MLHAIPQYDHSDNHRAERRPANWLAQVESRLGATIGRTHNVSTSGLLILSRDTLPPETEVTVRFHLPPGGHFVETQARVMRAKPGVYMGVQFLELAERHRQVLEQFIREAPQP
jgi:c-di-GMP-binding flagellar brake protein YcgR